MDPSVFTSPGNCAVGFEMNMLNPWRRIGHLVDRICCGESFFYASDLTVDLGVDITMGIVPFVVKDWRVWFHRGNRIENRRQNLVINLHGAAPGFGERFAFCDYGDDALPCESHHLVKNPRIVRVDQM